MTNKERRVSGKDCKSLWEWRGDSLASWFGDAADATFPEAFLRKEPTRAGEVFPTENQARLTAS